MVRFSNRQVVADQEDSSHILGVGLPGPTAVLEYIENGNLGKLFRRS